MPVLAITGGLILFLAALDTVMQQFRGPAGADAQDMPLSLSLAVSPLAFPTIVTPSGIAAVIIFVTLSPDLAGKLTIGLLLLVILLLDLIAMWYARAILKWLALPLYILGAVLGVIQVALGLNIMLVNLSQDRRVLHDPLSSPAGGGDERLALECRKAMRRKRMRSWPRYPVIYEINTWVWLDELSRKYNRPVTLATVPAEEWSSPILLRL